MSHSGMNAEIRPVFKLLKITFVILPIAAGVDKFTNLLTDWSQYLHPAIKSMLPFPARSLMMIAGIVEIIAGIIVLVKPAAGGLLVSAWLLLIALSLLAGGSFLDVAVRDMVMAISAFSMARMAKNFQVK